MIGRETSREGLRRYHPHLMHPLYTRCVCVWGGSNGPPLAPLGASSFILIMLGKGGNTQQHLIPHG
jgi:hypothetical protein